MLKYFVTAYFWFVFALIAPFQFLVGLILFLLAAPFDPKGLALHSFISRWTFQYLRLWPGWRIEVLGRDRLPKTAVVLVANHQSMADVVVLMGLFHPFKFVSKASLFQLPLVGQMMRLARYVSLERGKRSSHQAMMTQCRLWLRSGVSVLLFPEGTYRESAELLPFKRGAFVLAVEEQVPIVPIAIKGTADWVLGDGPWMNPKAFVQVEVLLPVLPCPGEDAQALAERVRNLLGAALEGSPNGQVPN